MRNLVLILVLLSALSFIGAGVAVIFGHGIFFGTLSAEALSRVSNNLALLAIAIYVWNKMSDK